MQDLVKELTTYDPQKVTIIITYGGVAHICGGFAEKSKVKVSQAKDNYTTKTGLDGHTVRQKTNNKTGDVEIHFLRQVSDSVDFLNAILKFDRAADLGIFALTISDGNSGDGWLGTNCFIMKQPDEEVQGDADEVTYKIFCTQLEKV